jgi:ribonucleoside-diphosphate reductase alpha chain
MLVQLGIPYNSHEAFKLGEKVMGHVQAQAEVMSQQLAEKRGNFPNYSKSIFAGKAPRRNATLTTLAPTGTIGIIANASGGIEPMFAVAYKRANVLDNNEMFEVNPYFEKIAKEMGFYSTELMKQITEKGSLKDIKEIPDKVRRVFVTAHDISPEDHIRMQAAFQRYTDNAVSKTVNFPHDATREQVANAYNLAYKLGCKGVTVYRDGSREAQVLSVGHGATAKAEEEVKDEPGKLVFKHRHPRQRPRATHGVTFMMHTGCGKMYVTVNEDSHGPCEIFTSLGKSGGCTNSQAEAVSRLISLSLRAGISQDEVVRQLKGIRCPSPTLAEGGAILSCADAIGKALENYYKERNTPTLFNPAGTSAAAVVIEPADDKKELGTSSGYTRAGGKNDFVGSCPQCPECGEMLEFGEGCVVCRSCGYSKCW